VQLLCSRDRSAGLSCIAVFANMSSSDSEDEMSSTVNDQILREAVYRGDLDTARRWLDEGGSTAGVFNFYVRDDDGSYDEQEETIVTLALQGMRLPRHLRANSVSDVEMIALLLDHGADMSLEGSEGKPLVMACLEGFVDAARLLLDRGAAVNGFNAAGWTPAEAAACGNHLDVLELLLERGASLDLIPRPEFGYVHCGTPFALACIFGSVEAARLLLERGSDIEGRDSRGATPLINALLNGQPGSVRLLLSRGADFERRVHMDTHNDWDSIAPVTLARGRRCGVLRRHHLRAVHVNAAFDTFFLARFIVAGRRPEHENPVARCSVLYNRDLVKVIAAFLVVKTPLQAM
jgi:ankyrin repeat protein